MASSVKACTNSRYRKTNIVIITILSLLSCFALVMVNVFRQDTDTLQNHKIISDNKQQRHCIADVPAPFFPSRFVGKGNRFTDFRHIGNHQIGIPAQFSRASHHDLRYRKHQVACRTKGRKLGGPPFLFLFRGVASGNLFTSKTNAFLFLVFCCFLFHIIICFKARSKRSAPKG